MFCGTIHSFALKAIQEFENSINKENKVYAILDTEDQTMLISLIEDEFGLDYTSAENLLKDNISHFTSEEYHQLRKNLDHLKSRLCILSFDDILHTFYQYLKIENFIKSLKPIITHLIVDEAQDLNQMTGKIVDKLVEELDIKIFMVGDKRQNIFGFAGGSFEYIDFVLEKYKDKSKEMELPLSYRCPLEVLNWVNKFKFADCKNEPLKPEKEDIKGIITLSSYKSDREEAFEISRKIKIDQNYSQTAILFTQLKYLTPLARELNYLGIPFQTMGGGYKLKSHIKFYLNLLKFLENDKNYIAFRQLLAYLGISKISHKEFEILKKDLKLKVLERSKAGKNINQAIQNYIPLPTSPILDLIIEITREEIINYASRELNRVFLAEEEYLEINIREDLDALKQMATRFETNSELLLSFSKNDERFKNFYIPDFIVKCESNGDDKVTLSTIHSAKGMEWDNIYIPCLHNSGFPNDYFIKKSMASASNESEIEKILSDELKKLYVAATRTKNKLNLSYSSSYSGGGKQRETSISRFLGSYPLPKK